MNIIDMHDWTLVSIHVDWKSGFVSFHLKNQQSMDVKIVANGLRELLIPQKNEWGQSVSVNKLIGPKLIDNLYHLELELQSGDIVIIKARDIKLPY